MARITVEDCILKVPNRFELVVLCAQRARKISVGEPLTVERDNDKFPVIALREVADETVDLDELRQSLVRGLQKHVEIDEPEEDDFTLLTASEEQAGVTQEAAVDKPDVAGNDADPDAKGADEPDGAAKPDEG